MVNLLKTFGKGILYIIGLPFFIVALAIFGVVGIFLFLFQLFKSIFYFFTGQKFFPELPEDKELRLRQEAANAPVNPVVDNQVPEQDPINEYSNPVPPVIEHVHFDEEPEPPTFEEPDNSYQAVEEACFDDEKEEEPSELEADLNETSNDEPEQTIDLVEPKVESVEEEELEEYIPKGSTYVEDIEEEDTHSGVDIDYDVR